MSGHVAARGLGDSRILGLAVAANDLSRAVRAAPYGT